MFVYSPLLFLALPGFYFLFRQNRWKFAWALFFLCSVIYIFSSWWCWHYACGLGIRPMTDFIPVFMILFAVFVNNIGSKVLKWITGPVVGICIFLNLVFSYQFYHGIINPYSMDAKKFWFVFLKTDRKYSNFFAGVNDPPPYAPNGFDTLFVKTFSFGNEPGGVLNVKGKEFPLEMAKITSAGNVSPSHYFKVSMKRKMKKERGGEKIYFVIAGDTLVNGKLAFYNGTQIKEWREEKANEWIYSEYSITFFNGELQNKPIAVYLYNPEKEEMIIDDLKLEGYAAK
jgi:hypothetical protein